MATDKTLDDNPKAIPTEAEAPPRYEGHSMDDKGAKQGEPHHTEAPSSSRLQVEPCPGAGKSKSFIGRLWGTVSRSHQEARTTVMTNIRRLMHNPRATSLDWTTLLDNCERICSDSSVSLSFLLQEYFIEDHTPLYWAIVKRDEGENDSINDPDLLTILMKAAAPLTEPTVSDIYCACIVTSDQPLFQSLRYMPSFSSPMSGIDQLLLSNTATRDQVTVEDIPGVNGSFVAMFEIAQFQKRMRVSKEIILEFIARGRMWRLIFFISSKEIGRRPRGSWCMSLCLLNHSPPTFIDAKFVIDEYKARPSTSTPRASFSATPGKSSIVIPCQAFSQLFSSTSSKHNALIMALEDSPIGSSVQYKGTTFLAPDETLRLNLHARLIRPPGRNPDFDGDCVIC